MADKPLDLDRAYDLKGAEDARALYRDWADSYDQSFGAAMNYAAPARVAEVFRAEAGAADTPVLDVGAGTGLLAENLTGHVVDALDLSPEMLTVAREKGIYRDLIEGDLTATLPIGDALYGGIVSSGTFTHGHVGPGCLPELLRICRPGALFACGVVPAVFDGMGFGSTLARLQAAGQISPLRFVEIGLYDGASHDHAHDIGLVMVFRRI